MTSGATSHVPTPLSVSLKDKDKDGGASNHATPTSATAPKSAGGLKKNSKKKTAAEAAMEDSETDTRETKKVRTNFGAVRK